MKSEVDTGVKFWTGSNY